MIAPELLSQWIRDTCPGSVGAIHVIGPCPPALDAALRDKGLETNSAPSPQAILLAPTRIDVRLAVQARTMICRRGRVFVHVCGAHALPWLSTLRDAGLEPKHLRFLHTHPSAPPVEALITARVAKHGGLVIESCLSR